MANNKFSDLLQQIQNTQIRIAIDRMFKIIGLTGSDTEDGTPTLTVNITGDAAASDTNVWDTVTTSTVDNEDGTASVQFVFKDSDGVTIAVPVAGIFYMSNVATGLTRDAATDIAVLDNGAVSPFATGDDDGWAFTTTAAGLLGITLGSAADSKWIVFHHPSGSLVISDEITITSGG